MRTVELIKELSQQLKSAEIENPRLEAEMILAAVFGKSRAELLRDGGDLVPEAFVERSLGMAFRRKQQEPMAYILGSKDFYKSTFRVVPGVLVPRPESEFVVEAALEFCRPLKQAKVYDFGCGSGCLGLSLLKEHQGLELVGFDIEETPLAISRENARELELEGRVQFLLQDINSLLQSSEAVASADLIIMNPPYLDELDPRVEERVRRFEPARALFCADHGREQLKSWIEVAARVLKPKGGLVTEIGCEQGQFVVEFLKKQGFSKMTIQKDYAGHDRVVTAIKSKG